MKVFISYSNQQEALARRIKKDLTKQGCDSWQFDISALPGTDAWTVILGRIKESDFFLVLLSKDSIRSQPVLEEISHAHYCSLNNRKKLPQIIPIILTRNIVIPAQIVRLVRLPFSKDRYTDGLARLMRAMGLEPGKYAVTDDQKPRAHPELMSDVEIRSYVIGPWNGA